MGRREDNKARRKQLIFRTALELFRTKGFAETTVEEIAEAADIAKGTFFNYFPTKEAVLLHLNEFQIARLHAAEESTPGFKRLSAREQIATIFKHLAAGISGQADLVRILIGQTLLHPPTLAKHSQTIGDNLDRMLAEIATRGQAQGEFRTDVCAAEIGQLLSRLYFLTILGWLSRPDDDLASLLIRNLDLLIEGLATERAREDLS